MRSAPFLAAPLSQATTYLTAAGGVGTLIGGPSQGYGQSLSPASLLDAASGSTNLSSTAGPYVPGGVDLYGEAGASSTARFGHLIEASSASARGYTALVDAGTGGRAAYAFDVITIHGSGTIGLTLHTLLIGSASASSTNNDVNGAGSRVRSDVYVGPAGFTDHSKETDLAYDYSTGSVFGSLQSSTVNVSNGDTLYVIAEIEEGTGVQLLTGADIQGERTLTAGTSADLGYWIGLTPGASLTSESGYLYQAVPEPGMLGVLGLGAVCLARRRRK